MSVTSIAPHRRGHWVHTFLDFLRRLFIGDRVLSDSRREVRRLLEFQRATFHDIGAAADTDVRSLQQALREIIDDFNQGNADATLVLKAGERVVKLADQLRGELRMREGALVGTPEDLAHLRRLLTQAREEVQRDESQLKAQWRISFGSLSSGIDAVSARVLREGAERIQVHFTKLGIVQAVESGDAKEALRRVEARVKRIDSDVDVIVLEVTRAYVAELMALAEGFAAESERDARRAIEDCYRVLDDGTTLDLRMVVPRLAQYDRVLSEPARRAVSRSRTAPRREKVRKDGAIWQIAGLLVDDWKYETVDHERAEYKVEIASLQQQRLHEFEEHIAKVHEQAAEHFNETISEAFGEFYKRVNEQLSTLEDALSKEMQDHEQRGQAATGEVERLQRWCYDLDDQVNDAQAVLAWMTGRASKRGIVHAV